MRTLTQLLDRRAAVWAQMTELQERSRRVLAANPNLPDGLSDSEQRAFDELSAEFDRLTGDITRAGGDSTGGSATSLRTGPEPVDMRAVAFTGYLRTGDDRQLRALGESVGTAGGYLVPQGFRATIIDTMKAYGGLRRVATVLTTETGADLPFPTVDDTSNVGVILAENTQSAEQDATFGTKTLSAYAYSSKLIRVSFQLLNDAGFDVAGWVGEAVGKRIGRAQAAHFMTGTGSSQPQGLITGSTVGKTTSSSSAITYAELVDLVHSVDVAYREGGEVGVGNGAALPEVGFMMNDATLGYLLKLTDSTGQPLIRRDVQTGGAITLLGYRVYVDNSMATIATGAKVVAFGNFRAAYVIRDVGAPEVLRLNERYADYLQVGFMGWYRSDGLVQDASAVKLLAMA